ncbi:MAG: M15 family metallopeptidase [Arenimonas sp.]
MKRERLTLINGELIEAIPAFLAKGRGNETRRLLATHEYLLRRKADGRFLAVASGSRFRLLLRNTSTQHQCETFLGNNVFSEAGSIKSVQAMLDFLGVSDEYGNQHDLILTPEPSTLSFAGFDRYQRPLWMQENAGKAWLAMQYAALMNGVRLEAISGYRGHAYQFGIFKRKLARGQSVQEILKVNAAPGFSEHHSGRAIDIGTPNEPAAEESFENTTAFAWLKDHAPGFGFRLSYPRNNPHDIVYEPWHWYFV